MPHTYISRTINTVMKILLMWLKLTYQGGGGRCNLDFGFRYLYGLQLSCHDVLKGHNRHSREQLLNMFTFSGKERDK